MPRDTDLGIGPVLTTTNLSMAEKRRRRHRALFLKIPLTTEEGVARKTEEALALTLGFVADA